MNIYKPKRIEHTYTQRLNGTPDQVFPLLCPVREADWIDGWMPNLVLSESGYCEKDCVFTTGSGDDFAVWVVVERDPDLYWVEMLKIIPAFVLSRLSIQLRAVGSKSEADVTYRYTSLSGRGHQFIEEHDDEAYRAFIEDWETRLNHFLETGEKLV